MHTHNYNISETFGASIDPRRVSGLLLLDQCSWLQADFDGQQQREEELMLFVPQFSIQSGKNLLKTFKDVGCLHGFND